MCGVRRGLIAPVLWRYVGGFILKALHENKISLFLSSEGCHDLLIGNNSDVTKMMMSFGDGQKFKWRCVLLLPKDNCKICSHFFITVPTRWHCHVVRELLASWMYTIRRMLCCWINPTTGFRNQSGKELSTSWEVYWCYESWGCSTLAWKYSAPCRIEPLMSTKFKLFSTLKRHDMTLSRNTNIHSSMTKHFRIQSKTFFPPVPWSGYPDYQPLLLPMRPENKGDNFPHFEQYPDIREESNISI